MLGEQALTGFVEGFFFEVGAVEFGVEGFFEYNIGKGVVGEIDAKQFLCDELIEAANFKGDSGRHAIEGELEIDRARGCDREMRIMHEVVGVAHIDHREVVFVGFEDQAQVFGVSARDDRLQVVFFS